MSEATSNGGGAGGATEAMHTMVVENHPPTEQQQMLMLQDEPSPSPLVEVPVEKEERKEEEEVVPPQENGHAFAPPPHDDATSSSSAEPAVSKRQKVVTSTTVTINTKPSPLVAPLVAVRPAHPPHQTQPKIYYHAVEQSTTDPSSNKATFLVISNDNTERNLVWLVCLKEIFAKQLPKMPREYIVRLLFDRSHQSLLCLEQDQVVGGISFKPYPEQRFGEIAFCAVSSTHQVKGFGTRLMNHLKEYVKRVNLTHFLTYADNFAIGYFKKQGFSSSISMPKERWVGYIKDYDGGTLMECVVNPSIDYFRIPQLIQRQRDYLLDKIAETKTLEQDRVYPGLAHLLKDQQRIDDPYSQIPGLKEAGWVKPVLQPQHTQITPAAAVARALIVPGLAGSDLQSALRGVVDQVQAHKDSWPFHEPVPASVIDYLEVIREPVDLGLIRKRVLAGEYQQAGELRRDLQLMLDNCRTYNRPDTTYYRAAQGLQKLVNDIFGDIPIIERR